VPQKPTRQPDGCADELGTLVRALRTAMGRGGLTAISQALGMTPTALKKRLDSRAPFDAPTMRAVLMLQRTRVTTFDDTDDIQQIGRYKIAATGELPKWTAA
jgi:phage gp45-like